MCAKVEPEPENRITRKGYRRREKVWLSDGRNDARWMKEEEEGGREGGQAWSVELYNHHHFSRSRAYRTSKHDEGGSVLSVCSIYFPKEVHSLLCISKAQR